MKSVAFFLLPLPNWPSEHSKTKIQRIGCHSQKLVHRNYYRQNRRVRLHLPTKVMLGRGPGWNAKGDIQARVVGASQGVAISQLQGHQQALDRCFQCLQSSSANWGSEYTHCTHCTHYRQTDTHTMHTHTRTHCTHPTPGTPSTEASSKCPGQDRSQNQVCLIHFEN